MRVALLTAKPNEDCLVGPHRFATDEKRFPIGIGMLYSVLKQNHIDVEIFDRYCDPNAWDKDNFEDYSFVGIYTASVCTDDIFDSIDKLKCEVIAVGGPHAYLYPDSFPEKVSYIVRGEAEKIIVPLVNEEFIERVITTDRIKNLDELPRYPYGIFLNRDIYTWEYPFSKTTPIVVVNSSRGCPFNCSFCSVKKIWGRVYTYYSAERVLDDLQYIKSIGGKGVYYREDNFTCNKKRLIELCELMIKNNVNLEFACESRVDTVDYETMKLMKDAGCVGFYVGVESLSNRMLDIYNKGVTSDQTIEFFENANKLGIKTAASMIKGHPEETVEDIRIQNRLIHKLKPTMLWYNQFRSEG